MSGPPLPTPRRFAPNKTTAGQLVPVSPTSEEMPVSLEKNTLPVGLTTNRQARVGFRRATLSQDGGGDLSVVTEETRQYVMKSLPRQCASLDQGLSNLRVGPNQEAIVERKIKVTERVIYSQKSWDEDVRNSLTTSQPGAQKRSDYKRCYSVPENSFVLEKKVDKNEDLMGWWRTVTPWEEFSNDYLLSKDKEVRTFTKKAQNVRKALHVYKYLVNQRVTILQNLINNLLEVADNLDKVSKGTKIAGITGGTAGAVGVAAAVGGVILAPMTMGASLAVTAVGVGVAAAGTATGASAAIANKVNKNSDRKKVENILKEYTLKIEEIEKCLTFICTGVEHLKRHNLSQLQGVDMELVKVAMVSQLAVGSAGAVGAINKSSGLIKGFTLGMDMYFTKEDSEKLKKGLHSSFATQIRSVAEQMQSSLDELKRVKNLLALQI